MSLVAFHRVLISVGILFCFGFAAWELVLWWVTKAVGALGLGVTFVALGVGLCWYLYRLNRFLGYEKDDLPRSR